MANSESEKRIAALEKEIAELRQIRGKLKPITLNLSKYDAAGMCVAEFRQSGNKIVARSGDAHLRFEGENIDATAAALIQFFRGAVEG